MNRRSFFKFMPAIFAPFLSEPKVSGEEISSIENKAELVWNSALGLGRYKSHLMTIGSIDGYYFPKNDGYTRTVNFPIEGQLTINFEKGIEKYVCFNPKMELVKEINELDSWHIFYNFYENIEKPFKDGNPFNRIMKYKDNLPKLWLILVTGLEKV